MGYYYTSVMRTTYIRLFKIHLHRNDWLFNFQRSIRKYTHTLGRDLKKANTRILIVIVAQAIKCKMIRFYFNCDSILYSRQLEC